MNGVQDWLQITIILSHVQWLRGHGDILTAHRLYCILTWLLPTHSSLGGAICSLRVFVLYVMPATCFNRIGTCRYCLCSSAGKRTQLFWLYCTHKRIYCFDFICSQHKTSFLVPEGCQLYKVHQRVNLSIHYIEKWLLQMQEQRYEILVLLQNCSAFWYFVIGEWCCIWTQTCQGQCIC